MGVIVRGTAFQGEISQVYCPGGEILRGNCPGGNFMWSDCPGNSYPRGMSQYPE